MNKTISFTILSILVIMHCILALIYSVNQIPNRETIEILSQAFAIHYTENIFDFSQDTVATIVTTLPLRLFESIYTPAFSVVLLRLVSFFLLFTALKSLVHRNTMLWFSTIYLLTPWILYSTNLQFNSFLEIGTALYFLSIVKMNYYNQIDNNITSQRLWFCIHLLSIFWCANFHYSWIILAFASLILIARNIIRIRLGGLIIASLIGVICFLPIILEPGKLPSTYDNLNNESNYGFGLLHVYPIIKSILYWLRLGSTLSTNDMLVSTNFYWISQNDVLNQYIKTIWQCTVYAAGALSLTLSIIGNYLLIKNAHKIIFKRTSAESSTELLSLLAIAILVGTIFAQAIAPHMFNSSEVIICIDFAIIPILLFIDKFYKTANTYHLCILCITASFLLFLNLFPSINSESYNTNNAYAEQAIELSNKQFN